MKDLGLNVENQGFFFKLGETITGEWSQAIKDRDWDKAQFCLEQSTLINRRIAWESKAMGAI